MPHAEKYASEDTSQGRCLPFFGGLSRHSAYGFAVCWPIEKQSSEGFFRKAVFEDPNHEPQKCKPQNIYTGGFCLSDPYKVCAGSSWIRKQVFSDVIGKLISASGKFTQYAADALFCFKPVFLRNVTAIDGAYHDDGFGKCHLVEYQAPPGMK